MALRCSYCQALARHITDEDGHKYWTCRYREHAEYGIEDDDGPYDD